MPDKKIWYICGSTHSGGIDCRIYFSDMYFIKTDRAYRRYYELIVPAAFYKLGLTSNVNDTSY